MLLDILGKHLIAQRYAVDLASDGEEAWEYIALFSYDLVVLDVMLPEIDGISLCKKLRAHDYTMPILMLTARNRSTDIVGGFNAGADDYLVKPFNFDELTVRIHALLPREGQTLASLLTWGNLSLDLNSLEAIYQEKPLNLTAKEYALLELFLRNHNRVFSLEGIIENLWTFEDPPTEGAVRTHVKTLRQKLKSAGAAKDLIETVYGLVTALSHCLTKPHNKLSWCLILKCDRLIQQRLLIFGCNIKVLCAIAWLSWRIRRFL